METRKVAYAVVLTAIAVGLSTFFIPVGPAKAYPVQAMVNVLSAVLLGPWYALAVAFAASIIRNALGTGTIFAFPGSMIGAFIAGWVYVLTKNIYLTALGEIIGTGIIGALTSTLLVAPVLQGSTLEATFFVLPFLASTVVGSIVAVLGLLTLRRAGVIRVAPAEK